MCNEFFCPNCRRHKDVSLKSERKSGSSYICTACIEMLKKNFAPKTGVTAAGQVFTISNEHVRTARINTANKRAVQSARRLENYYQTVAA
jgi:hypothetical protein